MYTSEGLHIEIDERWMREWLEFGHSQLESYLRKQAAFSRYLKRTRRS